MRKKELTAADVWAMFAETDRQMKESRKETDRQMEESRKEHDRLMQENALLHKETERKMQESRKEHDRLIQENTLLHKETERKMQETALQMKETDRKMQETDRQIKALRKEISGVGKNAGFHAEQYFQNAFKDNLTFGGEKYDKMIPNLKYNHKNINAEFDIVLVNGKNVALIEAKNRIHPDFVKEFTKKKLASFKKFFPEFCKCNIYLGIAGFSFDDIVLKEAKEYGIGIIRQVGKSIVINADNLKAY